MLLDAPESVGSFRREVAAPTFVKYEHPSGAVVKVWGTSGSWRARAEPPGGRRYGIEAPEAGEAAEWAAEWMRAYGGQVGGSEERRRERERPRDAVRERGRYRRGGVRR